MSILPQLRVLPPVGEHIRWQRSGQNAAAQAGAEGRVVYLQSGTAALALILQTISKRARESGSTANEVLVPAYGCPDIVSAIAFAGLRARLVDLDGQSPFPSAQAWCAAINANTAALVTMQFLGLRDPITPKEAFASGLPEGAFNRAVEEQRVHLRRARSRNRRAKLPRLTGPREIANTAPLSPFTPTPLRMCLRR